MRKHVTTEHSLHSPHGPMCPGSIFHFGVTPPPRVQRADAHVKKRRTTACEFMRNGSRARSRCTLPLKGDAASCKILVEARLSRQTGAMTMNAPPPASGPPSPRRVQGAPAPAAAYSSQRQRGGAPRRCVACTAQRTAALLSTRDGKSRPSVPCFISQFCAGGPG